MGRRATAIGECGQNARRYAILGSLTVETGNETMDQVFLFLPFGHAKRGDTYLIADFSKLGEHLARICQHLSWNCPPAAARHRLV